MTRRQCTCDNYIQNEPYVDGRDCRLCWKFHNDNAYNKFCGGTGVTPERKTCHHFGAATGDTIRCISCRGSVHLKIFSCSIHSKCTQGKSVPNIACCATCPDYTPRTLQTPTFWNLLYFIYPVHNSLWRWNLELLFPRIHIFNGRRIAALVTDSYIDNPKEVRALLSPHFDDILTLQNNPRWREMVAFEPMLQSIKSLHPSHITTFMHAKGVSRTNDMAFNAIKRWVECLYSLLDYPAFIQSQLASYPITGAFKKLGHSWPESESDEVDWSRVNWHYSGSFFHFRNRDVFSKPSWHNLPRWWSGIEVVPALWFRLEEAGVLFHEDVESQMNLYDVAYWDQTVSPAWNYWQRHRTTEDKV